MAGSRHWLSATARAALLACAALALAACGDGAPRAEGTDRALDGGAPGRAAEREVEAPEVFQVVDQGLWDGRPSLGGVWVAHADATDPERVLIRNQATGDVVVGALFRRERENPGPRLQVSSDAAAALGMLAGQPVALSVTALRRQEVPQPAAEGPVAAAHSPAPADLAASGPGDDGAPGALAEAPAVPRRGVLGLLGRRSAVAEAAPPAAETIDGRPLTGLASTAATPLPAPPLPAAPSAAPSGARTLTAPPARDPHAGAPERPFVQVGTFTIEANADSAAETLRARGFAATVRREDARDPAAWRVLAGPAATAADHARLMAAVRDLGFTDAYAVLR